MVHLFVRKLNFSFCRVVFGQKMPKITENARFFV